MKKRKNLIISVLTLLMILVSMFTITYAYWASTVNVTNPTDKDGNVIIGTGDAIDSSVTLTEEVSSTDVLVPTTITPGEEEINLVIFTYGVDWTEDDNGSFGDGTLGTLVVAVSNIKVNGADNPYNLVNVVITPEHKSQAVVLNDTNIYTVEITVTLNEPANQTEYAAVAGLPITFDVTFTVTPN